MPEIIQSMAAQPLYISALLGLNFKGDH